jgi:hypothetical protein
MLRIVTLFFFNLDRPFALPLQPLCFRQTALRAHPRRALAPFRPPISQPLKQYLQRNLPFQALAPQEPPSPQSLQQ